MNVRELRRDAGFTLVELMVVIIILGLLAGFGAVAFMKNLEDSKEDVAKTKCNELEDAILTFVMRNQGDQSADEILDVMVEQKRLNPDKLKDPWGERYIVTLDDEGNHKVHSSGKDKQDGTDDDIWASGKGAGGGSNSGF
ncbi:MAG: prepilin-type N-terminal cleavage/methylation domain-containing protein [Planctomycetota bacterium]